MSTEIPPQLRDMMRQAARTPPDPDAIAARNSEREQAHKTAQATGIPYAWVVDARRAGVDLADHAALRDFADAEYQREAEDARAQHAVTLLEANAKRTPPRFADAVADHPDILSWVGELTDSARASARQPGYDSLITGPSLLLTGPVGTGKTHQAYGAMRALAERGVSAGWEFITAADMYGSLRPRAGADSETELRRLMAVRLLILDDLGAAKDSDWTEEINYRLINHRYDQKLATLVTTNVTPRALGERIGKRVASRLYQMTTVAALIGSDRRRAVA